MEGIRRIQLSQDDQRWTDCESGGESHKSDVEDVSFGPSSRGLLLRQSRVVASTQPIERETITRLPWTVRVILLAMLVLCVLTFVVLFTHEETRITDSNLDRYFWRTAARDHDDRDQRDMLLPDEWVREYRLCEHHIAARKWDDDFQPGQRYPGGDATRPSDHNAFLDPGVCGTLEDVPSAHRVGRGGYPEIRLTLTEADLRTIYGVDGLDEGNPSSHLKPLEAEQVQSVLSRLDSPLEVVLQVRAARFDPRRGEFVFILWVERLYYDNNRDKGFASTFSILSTADHLKHRIINYLFNRARHTARLQATEGGLSELEQTVATAAASPFECAFQATDAGSTLRTTVRRIYAPNGKETMSAFRLACPYPLHPARPPTRPFTLQMDLRADKEWKSIAEIPPQRLRDQPVLATASLRMCSRVERRVTFAYCSAAVYNDRNLPTLRSHIRHHTYLGVQVFHLYVRYDPTPLRDLLAEEIRVGLVQLHPTPESVYFYLNGQPRPFAPYLDQHMHQFECQSNHYESAQYIVSSDLDEYLYFPPGDRPRSSEETSAQSAGTEPAAVATPPPPPSPRPTKDNWHIEQFAATCLARTPSGVIYFTGRTNAESALPQSAQLPPVYLLDAAAAAASPEPISPTTYASLTHMPLGCRSMMGDMLVQHARLWSPTSPNELPPGRLPSLSSIPYPYPYLRTSLPMNAPLSLPFSMEIRDWLHRTEDGECGRRRVAAAELTAEATPEGGCSLPTSDWTPSAQVPPPVCPLMLRFPWPVAWPDVATVPPKSLFRVRADIAIEVHGVTNSPARDSDPHPQFKQLLSAAGVRWMHFVSMHRTKQRHVSHLNQTELAAEAALAQRDSSESPFVHFHQRIMSDIDRMTEETEVKNNMTPMTSTAAS